MRNSARAALAALALLLAGVGAAQAATQAAQVAAVPNRGLKVVPLTLVTGAGEHRYRVEVAATPAQQATGMMYRRKVPAGTGMLFPVNPPRSASFWMSNTWVSLDLIFIGADRRVLSIAANAVPLSESLIDSGGPVIAVLELAGGEAARIGLRPGDKVRW
ncbi:DUF192 domain-containing protein [Sandaracinobacteroides saxicola]|uniref:DUF192 domain-containing protein n=2 Tax=Sandaracinobacteroides saxicola TaxID=2759707 RepID=A0A7G5IMD0_9SPHN|nr:DUF192 domain-containing protein [Sandaracinobacteroides saxicola]